jgi:hypothetical protein
MIKPTVGRVVWYWPAAYDLAQGVFAYPGSDQPMAATVAFVHSDRMVNLSVVDHNGTPFDKRSVTLLQEGDAVRDHAGYAEWMPFQKGQAAKIEQLAVQLKDAPATITVPPSADLAIEQEIQAKGLTAPRITPADLQANIASELYFTAFDGITGYYVNDGREINPTAREELPKTLGLLTFCVLVLRNGFTVTGESACASPENFDAEIGRKIARDNAVAKVWPLMGYQLRERLHQRALFEAEPQCAVAASKES